MKQIICLIGESGSGKSEIANMLKEKAGYDIVQSYTTRKPRHEGETGHIFITREDFLNMNSDNILAMKNIYGELYFTLKTQFTAPVTIYIVDPSGYDDVLNNIDKSEYKVIGVYIQTDLDTRYDRLKKRDGTDEAIRRINKDMNLFCMTKCDYMIKNNACDDIGINALRIKCIVEGI